MCDVERKTSLEGGVENSMMRSGGNERKSSDCDNVVLGLNTSESYSTTTCDLGLFNRDVMYRNNNLFFPQNRPSGVFTESQWQELERQNLINRYIVASIPVPPQLLFLPHLLPSSLSQSNSNSLSAEPWRCKRTDGKKWRCSRDVAPDHKYCERHAHKTKSRSRKEIHNQTSCHHTSWFTRAAKPKAMMQTPSKDDHDKHGFYVPHTCTLQTTPENHHQTTRHFFIDAWEKDMGIKKLSPSSSLSLSNNVGVAGYDQDDDAIGSVNGHLGIGMMMSSASASWMNSITSPLGEALRLGGNPSSTRGGSSNLASPYSNNTKTSCEDGTHALN